MTELATQELDFAAGLLAQALDAAAKPSLPMSEIAEAYREGNWRETHDSWESYVWTEYGIGGPGPRSAGPDTRPVYFIEASDGAVKIGVAANPTRRLATLQTASPLALRLLATIPARGAAGEAELHQRFAHARRHGEWFEPVPELLAYIAENGVRP